MASKAKQEKPLAYEAGGVYFSPEEAVCRYLHFIDADYEDWFFVLCGIAKELGEAGRSIAESWSQQGEKYDKSGFASSWKSASRNHCGRDMGILRRLALDNGFQDDKKSKPAPPPPDPKKIERQQRAELKKQRDEASAAGNARVIYGQAKPCQAHPYLKMKGVAPVKGLRVIDAAEVIRPGCSFGPHISKNSGRLLLVPIVDQFGHIQSLEAITPEGVKGYLAGAKKRTPVRCTFARVWRPACQFTRPPPPACMSPLTRAT